MISTPVSCVQAKKRVRDVESHVRGAKCENSVKDFLEENDIPYWMNVRVRDGPLTLTEFDFIIPGATIECKYDFHSSRIDDLIKQISTQLGLTENLLLYIYFLNVTDEQLKFINFYLPQKLIDHKRVKIITDLNLLLVHKQNYSYVILEHNLLYPFVTNPKNKGSICYVESVNYYKLKLIVDDDSSIFDDIGIVVFDKNTIKPCQAMNQQFDGYNDISSMTKNISIILRPKSANMKILVTNPIKLKCIFNVFHKMAPIDPSFMSNKYPNKLVKDVSQLCICGTHYIFSNTKCVDRCSKIGKDSALNVAQSLEKEEKCKENTIEESKEENDEESDEESDGRKCKRVRITCDQDSF